MKACAALCLLVAGTARAQTMLDQEQRLIEVHSLLLAMQPNDAPGALPEGSFTVGLEVITIPTIDGTTGGKRQITASDRTPAFPRPRLAVGLPAPRDFRAFAGLAYIPPVAIRDVSSHLGALEAGLAYLGANPLVLGVRGHAVLARSRSPVTDPATRDTLDTFAAGADLSAAYPLQPGPFTLTPFASAGLSRVEGHFTVTSDNTTLQSTTYNPSFTGGVRFFTRPGLEAVAQLIVFPGRLVHPGFSLSWLFGG